MTDFILSRTLDRTFETEGSFRNFFGKVIEMMDVVVDAVRDEMDPWAKSRFLALRAELYGGLQAFPAPAPDRMPFEERDSRGQWRLPSFNRSQSPQEMRNATRVRAEIQNWNPWPAPADLSYILGPSPVGHIKREPGTERSASAAPVVGDVAVTPTGPSE